MKLFNNLNLSRKLPEQEKKLLHSIGNNLLNLIENAVNSNKNDDISSTVEMYKREIDNYKKTLEILKNDNKMLVIEIKILRNTDRELQYTYIKYRNNAYV